MTTGQLVRIAIYITAGVAGLGAGWYLSRSRVRSAMLTPGQETPDRIARLRALGAL